MALKRDKSLELVLVGDKEVIQPKISGFESRIEILHTQENISCDEAPVAAIKAKPTSSIVMGQMALSERDDCGAFVSAGSTGAVLSCAFMKVGRIEGVSRPALCPLLPTKTGKTVLIIDVGANMDCKPINLVHFALMGDAYMRVLGRERPRIALVNVGVEKAKGNDLTHQTFELLEKSGLNFVGNMEARDTFSGNYDVIVCDGFVGNVLLKTFEGSGAFFSIKLKEALRGFVGTLGKLLLAKRLIRMKKDLSEDATGGAIFIGVQKPVIKAHGNSNAKAFSNAILLGARSGNLDLSEQIKSAIAKFEAKS